jgi:phosphatidylglycerol:prolipoprotein diacylglycerol transferase
MALALLVGIGWTLWAAGRRGIPQDAVLEGALWVMAAAVVGARLFDGLGNWEYYRQSPGELFRLWQGGLSFQGGLLAGLIVAVLYCSWRRLPFWTIAGLAVPGLALATAIGWLGALLHGANYGYVTSGRISADLPDIYGIMVPRFPTQILGIVWSLLLFAVLIVLWARGTRPQIVALVWLLLYAGGLFVLGFTRADETLYFGILRVAQLFYLGESVIAGIGLLLIGVKPSS